MNEFKTYHPIVNFIYFVFVIGFSCLIMNPITLIISCFCGLSYLAVVGGKKALKSTVLYLIPLIVVMTLINPLVNHSGITIIDYLPDGNPLTYESIVYGFFASLMIASVICWFSCYNKVMTSDKFIYLFGRIIPSLSLIFSMTLRFVPKFTGQLKLVTNAQRSLGRDVKKGSIMSRIKTATNILSIMITWSLENAVETADSMKSRGYGLPGRTSFSNFSFDKRDKKIFAIMCILAVYIFVGYMSGGMYFKFFPLIKYAKLSVYGISLYLSYFLLCITPVVIECLEVRRWKALISKI